MVRNERDAGEFPVHTFLQARVATYLAYCRLKYHEKKHFPGHGHHVETRTGGEHEFRRRLCLPGLLKI